MKKSVILSPLILVLMAACGGNKKEEATNSAAPASAVVSNSPEQIVGIASVEPKSHIVTLYSETGGIVKQIIHDINDTVKANDLIVELVTDVEQAQLEQAESKLATQLSVVASAKSQLESLKIKLENAKVDYVRDSNVVQSGGITKQAFDNSRFLFKSTQADVSTAIANINQQENRLKELQADINYSKSVIERKQIKAPVNGKVLSMDVKIGNYISPTQAVCDFAPAEALIAITEVDELFAEKVKVGMRAYIRPQGQTDTLAMGKVFLTSPYLHKKSLFSDDAANMEDRRVREVRVLLENSGEVLIGSRVECVILLK